MANSGQYPVDALFLAFQDALAGRYSIDRELGRGGMGVVYLAREVHLDRSVAIKLLPPDRDDPELRARFLREARLAAKLSHPNIIPIHAVDDAGGFVYYVMAFVDGETLAHRVRTRGPLSGGEGTRILQQAAWALAHAHAQGFIHRDVKPDNILLEAGTGRVLVADFGIAAAAGDAATQGVVGTPEFMSPEQALGKALDARTDLYGLGATAFFAFSGRLPFEGASATEILAKQVTETAPSLGSLGLAVPRRVAQLVDRCLAKDPDERPPSADALAEQLGVALEQRREMPVALRAFVKRRGRLDGSGTLLGAVALLPGSVGAALMFGTVAGFSTLALGATLAPLAYLVNGARHLSLLGFGHADLAPAFKSEIELAREEHAVVHARGASRAERGLRMLSRLSGAVAGVLVPASIGLALLAPRLPLLRDLPFLAFIAFNAWFVGGTGYLYLRQQREDVDTLFWASIWNGRAGRVVFGIARRLLGSRTRGTAVTHRATELSLGMAAENLFETLPKETRHALGDLPVLLRRLQDDAQGIRRRFDALQDALAGAGDAAASDAHADLRMQRDTLHAKLGSAVGALETIRLNLLRLHAGSGTVAGLTTHLDLATELSAEVERLLAAQDEVERTIAFPREIARTPA